MAKNPKKRSRSKGAITSEAALERGKEDAERLEEVFWELEEDADPQREQELLAEEKAVMADFDEALPPSADSPSIALMENDAGDAK